MRVSKAALSPHVFLQLAHSVFSAQLQPCAAASDVVGCGSCHGRIAEWRDSACRRQLPRLNPAGSPGSLSLSFWQYLITS